MHSFIWSCLLFSLTTLAYPSECNGPNKANPCSFIGQQVNDHSISDRTASELSLPVEKSRVQLEKRSGFVKKRGECKGHFKGWEHDILLFGLERAANIKDETFFKAYHGHVNSENVSLIIKCSGSCNGGQKDALWEIWNDSKNDHCDAHQVSTPSCTCRMIYRWGRRTPASMVGMGDERDINDTVISGEPVNADKIEYNDY